MEPLAPSEPVAEGTPLVKVTLPLGTTLVPVAETDSAVLVTLPLGMSPEPMAEADPLVLLPLSPPAPLMDSDPDDASLALLEMLVADAVAVPVIALAESVAVPDVVEADPDAVKQLAHNDLIQSGWCHEKG